MKRYAMIVALASALLTGMAACAGSASGSKHVSIGDEFVLGVGESAKVGENLRLSFDSVAEDSRCPEGVQCVWEGNARVVLGYTTPDHAPFDFSLNTSSRYTRDTTVQAYRIALIAVLPIRKATQTPDPKGYEVRLRVTGERDER